ncbi:hypothetical protein ACF8C6_14970 [Pseudomonas sp. zbq_18]|uniref:hypothetical protein n=1 Tax=Pseudomonadota TaxID=1224 RepID=UPI00370A7440
MLHLPRKHRLYTLAVLLGSFISLGSGPVSAADGSDRLQVGVHPVKVSNLEPLAEGGSERTRQHRLKRQVDVVSDGAERVPQAGRA